MIPNNITRENILQAIQEIDGREVPPSREQIKYSIVWNGKLYPPKYTISIANKYANGEELDPSTFSGGDETNPFLNKRDFTVINITQWKTITEQLKNIFDTRSENKNLLELINSKNEVISKYQPIFSPNHIPKLTAEEFSEFLDFKNNKHWSGLHRQKGIIIQDMDRLKSALLTLVDESLPIQDRLDKIKPVPGLGEAISTAILHITNPDRYGVWNSTSKNGLEKAGLYPITKRGASFGEQYKAINEVLIALSREIHVDLWTLDALWFDFVKEGDNEFELKQAVLDTISIGETIVKEGLDGKKLSQSPDAKKNQDTYNSIIKPQIEAFKTKNDGSSPNVLLNKFLNNYVKKNDLEDEFESQGFAHYGQKVNSYCWAAITKKEPSIHDRKTSFFPQLFILINNLGIRFGLCYGDHVQDTEKYVTIVKRDKEIQNSIANVLKNIKNLQFLIYPYVVENLKEIHPILINTNEDVERNWSTDVHIIQDIQKDDLPETIEEVIIHTFDALHPIFKQLSFSKQIPTSPNYWQVAPGEQAKDWDLCVRDGFIPIYGREYFKNISDDVLNYNKDQLWDYFIHNNPKANRFQLEKIWDFLHTIQNRDVVLTNRGKKKALGWGIVKSGPKRYTGNRDITFIRDVDWKETNLDRDLDYEQGKNFFQALLPITKEHFDSIINPIIKRDVYLNKFKKNIILYGPPGTGKTFQSIKMAYEIIFGESPDTDIVYQNIQEKLLANRNNEIDVSQLSWLDAIILTFYESENDKLQVQDIKNSRIIQELSFYKENQFISNNIWSILQRDSKLDSVYVKLKKKTGREFFDKDSKSNWFLTEKGKEYLDGLLSDIKSTPPTSLGQISFITFHQSYSYEDFVEGIRPEISDDSDTISYRIKDGIFKQICKKAKQDPQNNYVFIIDEINRGNISKIFGELITLLEENKRFGEKEELTVHLPYSDEEFVVPNNLYIIGTMNSTDKSIALVDVALRRRFYFERIDPISSLIQNSVAKKFFSEINKIIRALKNPDYQIGHSYFMKIPESDEDYKELKNVFITQILPLIEEYFYNDWEALATILGRDSINVEDQRKSVWNEETGEFELVSSDYDKIFGLSLKSSDEIFEGCMNNLGLYQASREDAE